MRIYLAGPLFTTAERYFNKLLAGHIEDQLRDVRVWLPQEHEPVLEAGDKATEKIFFADVMGIDQSDMVVAIMDGPDPDSGTSWECGYAYARGKIIFMVRTDFRGSGEDRNVPYNIMLAESCNGRVELPIGSIAAVADAVVKFIKEKTPWGR